LLPFWGAHKKKKKERKKKKAKRKLKKKKLEENHKNILVRRIYQNAQEITEN
jgi:hypothetical protein